ncbi:hypothetical protein GCM10027063_35330 [Promicromonospora xylanilytica]
MDWLTEQHALTGPITWKQAVDTFRSAVAVEETIRTERQRAHEALKSVPNLRVAHEQATEASRQAREALERAQAVVGPAEAAHEQATKTAKTARRRRREHREARPPWWEVVFTLGAAARRWHAEDGPLTDRQRDAEGVEERTTATLCAAQDAVAHAGVALGAATRAQHDAKQTLADTLATVDAAQADMTGADPGLHVPNDAWHSDEGIRERYAPWLDPRWNEARTDVFLAALDLHRVFLVRAGSHARALLGAAMDVVRGTAPRTAPPDAVLAAWQGLFLLAPVASSTFASVSRMLPNVGAEAFGWLLIDEAGQAAPQDAAGAIWRAQRVVAVGDPLQLEPVVTALHTTQARLRDHHDVTNTWLPERQSVQTLADRVTVLGTNLHRDGEPLWVGSPLRVHRRCDEPMFSVVNDAVYDGLMLHGEPGRDDKLGTLPLDKEEPEPPVLDRPVRESIWIDVHGEANGNWIPAEGDAAAWVLRGLMARHGLQPKDVLVVSPFRAAADRLRPLVRRKFGKGVTCGTVHVSQGKEAPAVIFVLGGGTTGARTWAATRPNLLNVAVSRAKHRLYVIGDREDWKGLPHFDVLAARLPVYEYGRPSRPV